MKIREQRKYLTGRTGSFDVISKYLFFFFFYWCKNAIQKLTLVTLTADNVGLNLIEKSQIIF